MTELVDLDGRNKQAEIPQMKEGNEGPLVELCGSISIALFWIRLLNFPHTFFL